MGEQAHWTLTVGDEVLPVYDFGRGYYHGPRGAPWYAGPGISTPGAAVTPSWSSLAASAAALIDQPFRQVSDPRTPEATAAISALTEAIVADGIRRRVAEFGVTKWLLERRPDGGRRPIEDCVREVDEEQR